MRQVVVLAVLTAASTALYLCDMDAVRPFSNLLQVLTLPGWIVVRVLGVGRLLGVEFAAVVANALGWLAWLILLRALLSARRGLVRGPEGRGRETVNQSRRRLLVDAPAAVVALTGAGGIVEATTREPWQVVTRRYTVPIRDLPASLAGLRLVQISDTHYGPRIPADFLHTVIDRAVSMRPDLFLLTGDYIHNGTAHIARAAALFRPLVDAGTPVVGVLGNHDWYGDGVAMSEALTRVGVRMIDNTRVFLTPDRRIGESHRDAAMCIAGVGDLLEDVVEVPWALRGVSPSMPRLLLAHNPDTAEMADLAPGQAPRVDLMLSGHTHGGQVALPFLGTPIVPSRYGSKYAGGLVEGPSCRVLISRGIGMSLIPIRFGVPPEIVEVTLVPSGT